MADRPPRVLLVVGETAGGIGRHVALLAERLGSYGVAAAVCGPASALAAIGDPPGVGVRVLESSGAWPGSVISARRRMRSLGRGFDVVHAHGVRAGVIAAARPRAQPLVVTWHNAPLVAGPARLAHAVASRYVARRAELVLGASADLTELARRWGARDARTTFVVAPPMPPSARSRREVRGELGLGERPMVLAVGRLQAQKRLDVLVAAAATWAGREDSPYVVIAGDGPELDALRGQVAALRAPVRLLGARSDVADLMTAADVVALPSSWEARSLVAQEALRSGVPLVTTPVGGLPDLVGDAALVVAVGDAPGLAAAIERLVDHPELARELAQRGRDRAATWPDADAAVADLVAIYRELSERR